MGTVTTGAPGSSATVQNSGTPQNAVFDFTIPKGDTGSAPPVSLLCAYSTPSQGISSGSPILFDRNALSYGSDISHTPGSSTFTVSNPGVYGVNFHGVLSPVSGSSFPLNLVTSLTLNGSVVPGASVPYNLQSATDASEQSFFIPVSICSPPANLQVTVSGGNGIADAVTMTVVRLGSVPCSDSST